MAIKAIKLLAKLAGWAVYTDKSGKTIFLRFFG